MKCPFCHSEMIVDQTGDEEIMYMCFMRKDCPFNEIRLNRQLIEHLIDKIKEF